MIQKFSFSQYVPANAVDYCQELLNNHRFDFKITRPRQTRLGDFTVRPGSVPRITVNGNLNPYNFLITYLHELAHLRVYEKHAAKWRKKPLPHGKEWKQTFQELLIPVLSDTIFPVAVLKPLINYARNPKASTSADRLLYASLKDFDEVNGDETKVFLMHLNEGTNFVFQNRSFVKGAMRRTRVLCVEKNSQRLYTIPAHALVETE
jgi:SprT protein